MLEIPLDIRGVIIKIFQPNEEYIWCAPFLWRGNMESFLNDLDEDIASLLADIIAIDGDNSGSFYARGAGLAARIGQIDLARIIIYCLLEGEVLTSKDIARVKLMLSDERKSVKILLDRQRQWPLNCWNLHDVPAWIIPTWIKSFRLKVSNEQISIISGGHLLAKGNWCWHLSKDSSDYVVKCLGLPKPSAP